jgi:hypothetical protein
MGNAGAQRTPGRRGAGCGISLAFLQCLLIALPALIPSTAQAQFLFRQINLSYLTRRADIIVQGRVVGVRYEPLPGYEHIPTVKVTLSIVRTLRGPETGQYTFRQAMPFLHPRGGKGSYQVGEVLLLFLPSPSQYGLSSPLAHEQGTFHIARDERGRELIANGFGNHGLFKDVQSDAEEEGLTLSAQELQTMTATRGPIDLDAFVSLVKSLTRLPRTK